MYFTPCMLQGVFPFVGQGLDRSILLDERLVYTVPEGKRTQLVYVRAGNSTGEMVFATLLRNGEPFRLFPVGAKSGSHVSLAVIEDLLPGTRVEVVLAAPEGVQGFFVVDVGLVETLE